jgi:hypothetical protein
VAEKCAWMNPPCKVPASVRVPAVNKCFCEDHYVLNILRFGVDLKGEKIGPYASDTAVEPK